MCNLDCTYCYYLHKQDLLQQPRSADGEGMLERHIRQYIEAQTGDEWCSAGRAASRRSGAGLLPPCGGLQARYRKPGQRIENDLQTNGTLLDEEWRSS